MVGTSNRMRVAVPAGGATLMVLVEAMGRINFGTELGDLKGMLHPPQIAGVQHFGWDHFAVDITNASVVAAGLKPTAADGGALASPQFFAGSFSIGGSPLDTFLYLPGWCVDAVPLRAVRGILTTVFAAGCVAWRG
jgi:beta-galactosidase